jgi:tRNA nucleotidyltransferase (CCA-adding enzyme)
LHNLSFVEDPTRVFRAIRFEQRLGFHIARHTENLIKNAVKMDFLHKLGGKRLLTELVIMFRERDASAAVERMASLGLLRFIHPELKLTPESRQCLDQARQIVSWFELLFLERRYEKWVVYFLSVCESLNNSEFINVCTRLSVSEHYREKLADIRQRGVDVVDTLSRRWPRSRTLHRSDIHRLFRDFSVEVLLYLMARSSDEEVKKVISLYFTQLQNVHCLINGNDILQSGVPAGPLVGKLLKRLLEERLNGGVISREDELSFVKKSYKELLR